MTSQADPVLPPHLDSNDWHLCSKQHLSPPKKKNTEQEVLPHLHRQPLSPSPPNPPPLTPDTPPPLSLAFLKAIATGVGAGLLLDFMALVAAKASDPIQPMTVCYASGSVPLLRFVTKELMGRKIQGVRVITELVSPAEMGVEGTGRVGVGGRRVGKVRW